MTQHKEIDLDILNKFLRGERAAVEAYDTCIKKLDDDALEMELQGLRTSHQGRVKELRQHIEELGGEPAPSSGAWGTVAKLTESAAATLGQRTALAALEAGEQDGVVTYRNYYGAGSVDLRAFVSEHLVPKQMDTRERLSQLRQKYD